MEYEQPPYNMKAVIPVAGAGTRLRPHTYTRPKPLIPVAGKPILCFIIDKLLAAGIEEFILVIGYLGEKIKHFVESRYPNLDIQYVYQEQRLGLGHAIWMARHHFEHTDEVLIVLGDTIFEANLKEMFAKPHSCLGIQKVDNPREFGVVEMNEEGFIRRVVEKPRIPTSNMAIVGIYKINAVEQFVKALSFIIENKIKTIGEYQLTDALMHMVQMGVPLTTQTVDNWFDCGKKEILLATNAMLLKRVSPEISTQHQANNTIIIPPVYIGEGCTINNSIIGPNVTIGDHSTINYAILRNSIIGSYSSIADVVLEGSVIGSDAAIKGLSQSLNIGDNTEIDFR